jgi:hypothetical protein
MTNWSGEFAKWAPGVSVVSYKGNPAQRRLLQDDIRMGQFQVLLTTYEYIIKDRPVLSKMKWVHMIIGARFFWLLSFALRLNHAQTRAIVSRTRSRSSRRRSRRTTTRATG